MTTPLTSDDLARLAELLVKATSGAWSQGSRLPTVIKAKSEGSGYEIVADAIKEDDAAVIVAMHEVLPALLAMAKDAERYRFLRQTAWFLVGAGPAVSMVDADGHHGASLDGDELDAAIDAITASDDAAIDAAKERAP